jgi:protein-S-isoprenylcysteine O-methyltransferase Ste14
VFASEDVQRWTLGTWDPMLLVGPDLVLFVGASACAAWFGHRVVALVAATWTVCVTLALVVSALATGAAGWGAAAMVLASVGSVAAAATLWFGRLPTEWFFWGPFAFVVAAPRTQGAHLRRSLVQLVVFWTTFFVVIPAVLTAVERRLGLSPSLGDPDVLAAVGVAMFAAGSALGVWSCVTMAWRGHGTPLPAETARDLVVAGPYAFVRNPMAVAGVIQVAGVGVALGSWIVLAVGVAGAVVWNAFIRPVEEADLLVRFGEPYDDYRREVRCWVPRWSAIARGAAR